VKDAAPTPDATQVPLDPGQLEQLRELGRAWGPAFERESAALPVDPSLQRAAQASPPTRWGRFVHVRADGGSGEELEATPAEGRGARLRRALLGPPIRSSAVVQERMRKLVALPVLSADALSSVAYGPEAILAVLVLAGGAGLGWSLPIGAAIACMILAVGISYRQTIRAYPHGGGSYIVATENLGQTAGLLAAAGLVTDYILTVTISTAAGLDAVSSAIPSLQSAVVPIGLATIAVLLLGNLRGLRQAAAAFSAPTYAFIAGMAALIIVGIVDAAGRGFAVTPHPALHATEGVGLVLVLRAFSSGATAMTGIEAISNAVPAFKPIEWRNARITLSSMVVLLITLFVGIVVLVHLDGIVPNSHETVLSQLAHRHFRGALYAYTQAATALILILAANTAFNDFPRVLYLLARDRYVARRYLRLGDRLAFSNGMIALALAAGVLFVVFAGKTQSLIPLYAVGVFLAFTLSQAGMVVHWWRLRGTRWRTSLLCNGFGCVCSAVVLMVAAITKFTEGAWVAMAIVLVFTGTSLLVRRHFNLVDDELAFDARSNGRVPEAEETPQQISNVGIVPVPVLNRATLRALAYASSACTSVLALHVSPTEEEGARFRRYWAAWGNHVPLEVIESPYRAVVPPTVAYIESLHAQRPDLTLTVVVPELVVPHWWQRYLHDSDAARLRRALRPLGNVVVTSVPFHVVAGAGG
jgi:amino acid transporter